jgi:hypothetical protein
MKHAEVSKSMQNRNYYVCSMHFELILAFEKGCWMLEPRQKLPQCVKFNNMNPASQRNTVQKFNWISDCELLVFPLLLYKSTILNPVSTHPKGAKLIRKKRRKIPYGLKRGKYYVLVALTIEQVPASVQMSLAQ